MDDLLSQVQAAQSSGLLEAGISIDALGGKVRDVDPGDTAFVHRAALATVQYTATFPPGTPKAADAYVRGFRAAMLPHWDNHAYVNYADASITDYQAAYFGDNASRLAEGPEHLRPRRVLHPAPGLLSRVASDLTRD